MQNWKLFRSIRWKIVSIYFLLVFIAVTIIGVFIMNQLEAYHMESVRKDFTRAASLFSLEKYDDLALHQEEIQANLESWSKSLTQEVFVVDNTLSIIASSNTNVIGRNAIDLLDEGLLVEGLSGKISELDSVLQNEIPVKNMVFPIGEGDSLKGVLYLRADLSNIYETMDQAKLIFVRSMIISLLITVFLGFLIARSITVPINDVTEKAEKMVRGDFSQEVDVMSDDEIGRLAEMFNLLRSQLDITLSEISNEKNKLAIILQSMADGLLAFDLSGRVIHANPAARQILSISDEDIEARNVDAIFHRHGLDLSLSTILEKSSKSGSYGDFDLGGSVYLVRYERFQDENGKDTGIIMILQDITERQKLERMQRDFVANVSHELKTPLTTIKSYTETLLDGAMEDRETAKNFLTVVDTEADRMSRLVKDLLELSRMDYQRVKWNKKDVDLIALLRSIVNKVAITAEQKSQHLNCIFDESQQLPAVIDLDRMEQVILNILTNAIKYTQEGGRIDIDAVKLDRKARIIITDNGIGIAEKELPRIFERFYRVDKARSRAMGGTGLGLAIAKQIVEEHKGTIQVESIEGRGTKVSITLPLTRTRGRQNIE